MKHLSASSGEHTIGSLRILKEALIVSGQPVKIKRTINSDMRMKKLFSLFLITIISGSNLGYAQNNPTTEFKQCLDKEISNREALHTTILTTAQKELLTIVLPAIDADSDRYKPYWKEYYQASEKWLAENKYDYAEYDKASRNFPHAEKLIYFGSAYNRFFQLVNEGAFDSFDPMLQSKIDQFCEERVGKDPFCLDLKYFLKSTVANTLSPDFTKDATSYCLKKTEIDKSSNGGDQTTTIKK